MGFVVMPVFHSDGSTPSLLQPNVVENSSHTVTTVALAPLSNAGASLNAKYPSLSIKLTIPAPSTLKLSGSASTVHEPEQPPVPLRQTFVTLTPELVPAPAPTAKVSPATVSERRISAPPAAAAPAPHEPATEVKPNDHSALIKYTLNSLQSRACVIGNPKQIAELHSFLSDMFEEHVKKNKSHMFCYMQVMMPEKEDDEDSKDASDPKINFRPITDRLKARVAAAKESQNFKITKLEELARLKEYIEESVRPSIKSFRVSRHFIFTYFSPLKLQTMDSQDCYQYVVTNPAQYKNLLGLIDAKAKEHGGLEESPLSFVIYLSDPLTLKAPNSTGELSKDGLSEALRARIKDDSNVQEHVVTDREELARFKTLLDQQITLKKGLGKKVVKELVKETGKEVNKEVGCHLYISFIHLLPTRRQMMLSQDLKEYLITRPEQLEKLKQTLQAKIRDHSISEERPILIIDESYNPSETENIRKPKNSILQESGEIRIRKIENFVLAQSEDDRQKVKLITDSLHVRIEKAKKEKGVITGTNKKENLSKDDQKKVEELEKTIQDLSAEKDKFNKILNGINRQDQDLISQIREHLGKLREKVTTKKTVIEHSISNLMKLDKAFEIIKAKAEENRKIGKSDLYICVNDFPSPKLKKEMELRTSVISDIARGVKTYVTRHRKDFQKLIRRLKKVSSGVEVAALACYILNKNLKGLERRVEDINAARPLLPLRDYLKDKDLGRFNNYAKDINSSRPGAPVESSDVQRFATPKKYEPRMDRHYRVRTPRFTSCIRSKPIPVSVIEDHLTEWSNGEYSIAGVKTKNLELINASDLKKIKSFIKKHIIGRLVIADRFVNYFKLPDESRTPDFIHLTERLIPNLVKQLQDRVINTEVTNPKGTRTKGTNTKATSTKGANTKGASTKESSTKVTQSTLFPKLEMQRRAILDSLQYQPFFRQALSPRLLNMYEKMDALKYNVKNQDTLRCLNKAYGFEALTYQVYANRVCRVYMNFFAKRLTDDGTHSLSNHLITHSSILAKTLEFLTYQNSDELMPVESWTEDEVDTRVFTLSDKDKENLIRTVKWLAPARNTKDSKGSKVSNSKDSKASKLSKDSRSPLNKTKSSLGDN